MEIVLVYILATLLLFAIVAGAIYAFQSPPEWPQGPRRASAPTWTHSKTTLHIEGHNAEEIKAAVEAAIKDGTVRR